MQKIQRSDDEGRKIAIRRRRPECALRSTLSSPSAFTLMELLVVIAVIAILLGIIMPSFFTARDRARYTKAKVTVKNLETAFKAYLDQYRVWPTAFGGGSAQELDETVVKILRGDKVGDANSAKITFYEFESTNSAHGALDAWSDPNDSGTWRTFRVQVDHDYDNKIDIGGQTIYRTVVVWSVGTNRVDDSGGGDDVRSWD